jgi:hypothetical protein
VGRPHVKGGPPVTARQKEHAAECSSSIAQIIANAPVTLDPKSNVTPDQIFPTYAGCSGDIFKTARACGITPQEVATLADEGGWLARISELIDLKKLDKFDDVGRALSRATNFVQANRWRIFIERMIREFEKIPDNELIDTFKTFKVDRMGESKCVGFSMRVLADISTALEKCHWLLYQSLSDTPPERATRKAVETAADEGGEVDMHARIARAMAGVGMKTLPEHGQDAQDAIVLTPVERPPTNPD